MIASWSWWPSRENTATKEDILPLRQLFRNYFKQVSKWVPAWKQVKARCWGGIDWSTGTLLLSGYDFDEVDSILKDPNDYT